MEQFKSIGTKQCFVDALDKVTGKAKYLDDISFPGLLIGKILRSPHPHARILSIDTSEAEKLSGVRAVITAKDCPRNKFGMEIPDVDMLAVDKVRYVGDEVAAVAADTDETAREALKLIKVEVVCRDLHLDPFDHKFLVGKFKGCHHQGFSKSLPLPFCSHHYFESCLSSQKNLMIYLEQNYSAKFYRSDLGF